MIILEPRLLTPFACEVLFVICDEWIRDYSAKWAHAHQAVSIVMAPDTCPGN